MSGANKRLERRLRVAGVLIILGLVVEILSLVRIHPLAFLSFMFIGGAFLVAGVALYLYSLVSTNPAGTEDRS
jgi:predicted membrane channel-forming protein YqfA (hemolysin III family)